MMRVIFLGTPDFALPSLKAIFDAGHQVVAVVCQPDKPSTRGKIRFSPVKQFGIDKGIPVYQFTKIRKEGVEIIKELNPDIMVTAAYGQIISQEILDIPKYGVINVHGSLLPKYRGAAPIQQAILDGEKETGITIMQTALAVDSGDILLTVKTPIEPEETAGELFDRLAEMGAKAVVEGLALIESGRAVFTPQDHSQATFCKMFTKEMGLIDFDKDFLTLKNFVRGMNPWPGAFTHVGEKTLKVFSISACEDNSESPVGSVLFADNKNGLIVKIKNAAVSIDQLQMEGGKRMDAKAYLLGHKIEVGTILK